MGHTFTANQLKVLMVVASNRVNGSMPLRDCAVILSNAIPDGDWKESFQAVCTTIRIGLEVNTRPEFAQ